LSGEPAELLTFVWAQLCEHGPAVFDMGVDQPDGEPLTSCGECDANDAAIVHNAAAPDEPLTFEAIQCGGDGRDGGRERLCEALDVPVTRASKDFKEANVIRVQIRVDTAGQKTGLDAEMAHQQGDALVQGECLLIINGVAA
jgi:hypothetical protein